METEEEPAGLLTQTQYAVRRGWSKQYVNQLVKLGRIPLRDGRIDPAAADAALARDRDPSRDRTIRAAAMSTAAMAPTPSQTIGAPTEDPSARTNNSYAKARTAREYFRAQRERIEYEHVVGQLLDKQEVIDANHEIGVHVRQEMMRLGERVADRLVLHGVDHAIVVAIMAEEVRDVLTATARRIDAARLGFSTGMVDPAGGEVSAGTSTSANALPQGGPDPPAAI